MSAVKTSSRFGKKPGAGSAPHTSPRKPGTTKAKGADKTKGSKTQKAGKPPVKYSSLKSKQMAVENAKRLVWASMQKITEALITNATAGHLSTAKELFEFAGVYSLTEPEDENASAAAAVNPAPAPAPVAAEAPNVHPIDLFLNKLGIEPSTALPEPEAA